MSYYDETIKKLSIIPRLIAEAPHSGPIVVLQCLSGVFSAVGIPLLIPVLDYLKDGTVTTKSKVLLQMENVLLFFGIPVTFGSLLVVCGILFMLGQVLLTISTLIAVYAQAEMSQKYRNQLMDSYAKVSWPWLLDSRTGEINYFALREADMASVAHVNAQRVLIYSVQFLVLLGIAVQLSVNVTFLAIAVYAVIAAGNILISRRITKTAAEYHKTFSKLSNDLVVLQQNKKFFKTSLLNARMTSAIKDIIGSIAGLTKRETSFMEYQRIFGMTVTFAFLLVVMYFHKRLGLDYSALLVILFVFSRIAPNFSQLTTAFATLDSNIPAYNAVRIRLKDLDVNREASGAEAFSIGTPIRFDEVSFFYPSGKKIFDHLNFEIGPKRTTAIFGPSGVGKSTLLDLILGLLKPTAGSVFYGTVHHDQLDQHSFRQKVAYVGQETTLVEGTLEENLSIRVDDHDQKHMESILHKVGLGGTVEGLPQGLQTQIGENGVKLSGGQRQRVALARALLMEPEILILDEATSNLDENSEKAIMDTVQTFKNELTIVIVTHRVNSVKFADKTYVLNGTAAFETCAGDQTHQHVQEQLKQV